MSCFSRNRFGWSLFVLFMLTMFAIVVHADDGKKFRYCYVSLDDALPSGFLFFDPAALDNQDRVYGTIFDELFNRHIAVYEDGVLNVLQPLQPEDIGNVFNSVGTLGGSVLIDPVNVVYQAALFYDDQVELIPPQPGEIFSWVIALNDAGTALVESFDTLGQQIFALYKNGESTVFNFGPTVANPFFLSINNQGIISGTTFIPELGLRGFRFNTRTGETTVLDPLTTEPDALTQGINNRGEVLGYSFFGGGLERIGIWNRKGKFKTYFVEGTPEFPTISNRLLFNDNNLIVITVVTRPASETDNSYLVPKPGVRLNLADLVENLPSGANLSSIQDLNDHGNIIGGGSLGTFLLERIEEDDEDYLESEACTTPAAAS